ncbi:phage tail assembly chaperone [Sphingomonas sp. CCH18-H6]|uniref:phage tail assembly chaperone n=1 Tax=Sphingomonas sp. CCH18-H6 TaxID=1768787 RepID=UPI000A6A42F7
MSGVTRGEGPLHHSLIANGPPPRAGEDFAGAAGRLAGMAGAVFGWSPDQFWRATPAELAALVQAVGGEASEGVDRATVARLMEAFPDG